MQQGEMFEPKELSAYDKFKISVVSKLREGFPFFAIVNMLGEMSSKRSLVTRQTRAQNQLKKCITDKISFFNLATLIWIARANNKKLNIILSKAV